MYVTQNSNMYGSPNPVPSSGSLDYAKTSQHNGRELTVAEWFECIQQGLDYRREFGCEDHWSSLEQLFYNVHDAQANAGPNLIMSQGDAMMSALTVPFPYVTVKSRRTDHVAGARIQESVDNMLIEYLDIPEEVKRMTLNAYLFGRGILKIGYDSQGGYDPRFDAGKIYGTDLFGLTQTQVNKKGQRIEFSKAAPGMPWVESVAPHDFIVPWGVYDLEQAPWVAHRTVRHIDELRQDVKYDTRGLAPCMSMEDWTKSYLSPTRAYRAGQYVDGYGRESGTVEYVELWEIHDRRTQKCYVIATGHDKFLRNQPDYIQINGELPFVTIGFIPRSRNFWCTPDAYYLKQAQLELSDISIQNTKHRRARVLKFLYRKGLFTPEQMENLLHWDVGIGVEVSELNDEMPLQQAVTTFQPQADLGLMQEAQFTERNAQKMIGMSANQVGEFDSSSRRSATEAALVSQASTLRMDRRQSEIAKVYQGLFQKINPILWALWSAPRQQEIIGPDGAKNFVMFKGSDIRGEYKYQVGFSIDKPESLQQRRANAMQTYLMLRQDPAIDPIGLARMLNFSINDPEFSAIFKPGVLDGSIQPGQIGTGMEASGQTPGGGQQTLQNGSNSGFGGMGGG